MEWWQLVLTLVLAMALVVLSVLPMSPRDTDDTHAVIKEAAGKKAACEERTRTEPEKHPAKM